jgi:hypothetical protein
MKRGRVVKILYKDSREQLDKKIIEAIDKAKKGIAQYIEIMDLVHKVDVSKDISFQKKYNSFYRIRQRSEDWYRAYYSLMQRSKKTKPTFGQILDKLNSVLGRYEPSFSSKLVATLNPNKPIWDIHILANTKHRAPAYSSKDKITKAKKAYGSIEKWYRGFMKTKKGKTFIRIFDEKIPEHKKITDLKKIDFILWQMR